MMRVKRVKSTLEMRTLIPACLLSQPNSLMVSPALSTTSFLKMYSLYSRLLDALCNHAAPQSNSSCNWSNAISTLNHHHSFQSNGRHWAVILYLVTVVVTVKWTHRPPQTPAVRSSVPVSKLEYLQQNGKKKFNFFYCVR